MEDFTQRRKERRKEELVLSFASFAPLRETSFAIEVSHEN